MMNIVNGGRHADNPIDIQEFMILPVARRHDGRCGAHGRGDLRRAARSSCTTAGHNTNVGDEGGFAPNLASADEALGFIAGPSSGPATGRARTSRFAIDCAANEFYRGRHICLDGEGRAFDAERHGRTTWRIWSAATRSSRSRTAGRGRLGRLEAADRRRSATRIQLVGDDMFVTNPERLQRGIERRHRQRDPGQGEPDRHADRDAGGGGDRAARRLSPR